MCSSHPRFSAGSGSTEETGAAGSGETSEARALLWAHSLSVLKLRNGMKMGNDTVYSEYPLGIVPGLSKGDVCRVLCCVSLLGSDWGICTSHPAFCRQSHKWDSKKEHKCWESQAESETCTPHSCAKLSQRGLRLEHRSSGDNASRKKCFSVQMGLEWFRQLY